MSLQWYKQDVSWAPNYIHCTLMRKCWLAPVAEGCDDLFTESFFLFNVAPSNCSHKPHLTELATTAILQYII